MKTAAMQPKRSDIEMVELASRHVMSGEVDLMELATAENQLEVIQETARLLLPIEQVSGTELRAQERSLAQQVMKLRSQKRIWEYSEGAWLLLDIAPLLWRSDQMLPRFGIYSLDSPVAGWRYVSTRSRFGELSDVQFEMIPGAPATIAKCFDDVRRVCEERARMVFRQHRFDLSTKVDMRLSSKFSGLIPGDVKDDIECAQKSNLFRSVRMIAEVEEWVWDQTVESRKGDPLVVGWDGFQLWLIRAFDTTSTEQIFAEKFAFKP